MTAYVYILASKDNRKTYIGVTSNLERRLYEHKNKLVEGYTKRHNITKLVYYEYGESMYGAITREKQLKKRSQKKKTHLVCHKNPNRKDLAADRVMVENEKL